MKTQLRSQVVLLADMSKYFDRLLPRELPRASLTDPEDNAIEQKQVYVLGDMGAGKTNTTKLIVNEAVVRFGVENVFVLRGKAEQFPAMLEASWPKRLCIVLLVEDVTGVPVPDALVVSFFRVREIMMQKTNQREGLILIVFSSHRLHESLVSLRATYTSLLVLSSPMNDWDHAFIERKVGGKNKNGVCPPLQLLEDAEEHLQKGNMLVTYRRKFLGATKLPRLNFNFPVQEVGRKEVEHPTIKAYTHIPLINRIPQLLSKKNESSPQRVKSVERKPRFCIRCGEVLGSSGKCGNCG